MCAAVTMMTTSISRCKNDLVNAKKSRERKKAKAEEKHAAAAGKAAATRQKASAQAPLTALAEPPARTPPSAWDIFKLSAPGLLPCPAYEDAGLQDAEVDKTLPFIVKIGGSSSLRPLPRAMARNSWRQWLAGKGPTANGIQSMT